MPVSSTPLKKIEEAAFMLIKQYKIKKPPIAVENIASKMGLGVIAFNFGDDISGMLVLDNGVGSIGYNPSHTKTRQRFTIAHEMGHFQLHIHNKSKPEQLFVDKDFLVKFRNATKYTAQEFNQEREANAFAAALLMPKEFIVKEINKEAYKNLPEIELISKLAEVFNVSIPAMTYRLNNLNILF